MKYLIALLLLLFLAPASAQKKAAADAISSYFGEYVDDERFTAVYVSGKMFALLEDAQFDLDGMDEKEIAAVLEVVKDLQAVRVLHTETTPLTFYRQAKDRIRTDAYELLFKVRTQDGQNVEAFIQDEGATIRELFLLVGATDGFAMLSFVGEIDLSKLGQLQKALE
ncbi:hypothetical protein GGR26_002625 [Lewinella marina]|uniref:DUF4252 domain-containing protein n=1 Tax=Neolewinella marina TaxID=438751 RepID=A0A2G0CDB1_9BACT|nr:DUF4252 domain-containing protein [Neolewinella marina]NJB86848.1 hypothetical protein [Neolewinella marina]PHK97952.1 hypothetical protein CGL56_14155 [Neolewinella marina]